MKSVFISQSNYIPWRGYFDAINSVDEFIVLDDVQYTKRDWRNRNKIKTASGELWLTIPIEVKNKFHQKITEAKISDPAWANRHWKTLVTNYAAAPYFKDYAPLFQALYLEKQYTCLTEVNYAFLKLICSILNISTKINFSSEYPSNALGKTDRLLSICKQVGATDYYSGPSAKNYLDEGMFEAENIHVHYFDFTKYKSYSQLNGKFMNEVSILDLIFNEGPFAKLYFNSKEAEHLLLETAI